MTQNQIVRSAAPRNEECQNCGREITGKYAYDTDHGTCCSENCAALRIEDARELASEDADRWPAVTLEAR